MDFCRGKQDEIYMRELWATLPAFGFVALLVVVSLPVPLPRLLSKSLSLVREPFLPALTLTEAEKLERQFASSETAQISGRAVATAPRRHTALFVSLMAAQLVAWILLGAFNLARLVRSDSCSTPMLNLPWAPFLTSVSWSYAMVRVLHRPPVTPPFYLFILCIFHLVGSILTLGGQLYDHVTWNIPLPLDGLLVAESIQLALTLILFSLILSLPLNVPDPGKEKNPALSPEDHTSLFSWITFSWLNPLIIVGTGKTLNGGDVWDVSPTLKSQHTYVFFRKTPGSSYFRRLIRANSWDLIFEILWTQISVILEFCSPFLLRSILEGLENVNQGSRNRLYVYAVLAFVANLLQGEADLQHRWYSRRAALRIGAQLSVAIYDKTLRITDQSGVITSGAGRELKDSPDFGGIPGGAKKKRQREQEDEKSSSDIGRIVNLMTIDRQKVQDTVASMRNIYTTPLQLILSCTYLYNLLGISAFAGFLVLVLAIPISQHLASRVVRITKGTLAAKDERMKLVHEMFGAIKFIKIFAWENQWIDRIMAARGVEIRWLKESRNINVCFNIMWQLVPNLVSVMSFFVFVSMGHELTVSVAFTAIRLFYMLKVPLDTMPYALVTFFQMKVSFNRLEAFFGESEVPDDVSSLTRPITTEPEELKIEHGTFRWITCDSVHPNSGQSSAASSVEMLVPAGDEITVTASPSTGADALPSEGMFELKNINFKPPPGKLTVVTGPTASGKTALLMALLGEMKRVSGKASIPKNPALVDKHGLRNSISYADQTPWLQQQSIKDNIVFGYPFDQERYDTVVEACALKPDFEVLEDSDRTEIGFKGVSLSGGQKARVALARAVYAPTQYLILDDIFSAVDTHTARFILKHLFRGSLVAYRTVVLVTHHPELVIPATHYLVQLIEGGIHLQGTVDDLKEQGLLDHVAHVPCPHSAHKKNEVVGEGEGGPSLTDVGDQSKQARKLVQDEVRAEGGVTWSVYKTFLKASSHWTWVFVLLGTVTAELLDICIRIWMGIWGSAYHQATVSIFSPVLRHQWVMNLPFLPENMTTPATKSAVETFPNASTHPLFYVVVYFAISVVATFVAVATQWILFTGGLRAGFVLFGKLLTSLSAGTFRFFDTTPTGRILNRFGKDFDMVDGTLPFMLHYTSTSLVSSLGAVIAVIVVVPWFLPFAVILAYCYVRLSIGYLATSRDLRRLESTSRSPILAGFTDLVNGIVTIRAFSAEARFLDAHCKRVDTTNKFWYFMWMLNRWLLLRLDALGASSVFVATVFALSGYVPVGYAALAIVSAMAFNSSVYWTCRGYTELELCLNSVERVVEFLDIPKEPSIIIQSKPVPAYWPSNSSSDPLVVIEGIEVKYAPDLPSVLHDVSFSLNARERVGVVGRTGCGKSTLAMSLVRFVEPTRGKIIIDGIDISTIGTHDLRSRITFIPQDATLFTGTIRYNLDPFNEHTDAECLNALARVQLITLGSRESSRAPSMHHEQPGDEAGNAVFSPVAFETAVQSDPGDKLIVGLDTAVSAGGQNFSNGQRQLLAMARALLRQSAIVILDEATSSIDKTVDAKIQITIREEFGHSLMLTIAHRLGTVIDFDRVIVMDEGRVVEFDTPLNLLRCEGGVFREMCVQGGMYAELEAAARPKVEML